MNRRNFLGITAGALGGLSFHGFPTSTAFAAPAPEPFAISLAEWSLNKTLFGGKMTHLDFPRVAKEQFGIDCVEYVDGFFVDKARDQKYLAELKKRADSEGVTSGLIMIDGNGPLGASDKKERNVAIDNTFAWIDAAVYLGCKTIRVNARGVEDPDELLRWVADSCARLADYAAERNINVTIENHGGPSSELEWLVSVMKAVDKANFGTLPDFGNFPDHVDRYDAVEAFMPYAKAVSAKAIEFTPEGIPIETDFYRMMRIVRDGGYTGHVGIETCPRKQEDEAQAIRMARDLLIAIREEQKRCTPIFNGKNLDGWVKIEGGDWTVKDDVLVGRKGRDWSTDPEKTGSWLRTADTYGDFRLELQYMISTGGNSGIFFRSAEEKNPAFTGYEMQIYDAPGRNPSTSGPGALYDLVAPTENRVRKAGEWNTVTIVAQGNKISIEMNGVPVLETEQNRSLQGYIGLQNHDDRAVVRFRNIRIKALS